MITLTLSHFLGPTSFFELDLLRPWAADLRAKLGCKLAIRICNATSPLGDVTRQATQVKDGAVDIALGLRGAEGHQFPRSAIVELPFVVRDAHSGSRALWEIYQDGTLGREYRDYKVLGLCVHNPGLIHTTTKRVIGPEDVHGVRLRAPNATIAAALESIGAIPMVLQVNDVMPAVRDGRIDGIVTNWGNPLPGFNDAMKFHTDVAFYSSAFFVLMNRQKFAALPMEIRTALDELSNAALVARFSGLWDRWDKQVRDTAAHAGHEIIVPDATALSQWRAAVRPAVERYLASLAADGFVDARAVYDRLVGA